MYKIVVFWRWDKGNLSADCFWCVDWPEISNEEFDDLIEVGRTTYMLQNGTLEGFNENDPDVLAAAAGYPDAANMLRQIPVAELRARFNQMEMEVFNSDIPLTREQVEEIKRTRREP